MWNSIVCRLTPVCVFLHENLHVYVPSIKSFPLLGVSETIHIKHVFKMFNIPNFLPVQISYIKFESVSASQNGPEHLDSRSNRLILWPISNKSFVQVPTTFPQMAGFTSQWMGSWFLKSLILSNLSLRPCLPVGDSLCAALSRSLVSNLRNSLND